MSKTVQSVKNSLKFKAVEKDGILSVRVGVKKFTLPVTARLLTSDGFMFLSFGASSELYRVTADGLAPMDKSEEASDAFAALNTGRKRGARRKRGGTELAPELAEALKGIPAGYRLGYTADGTPRLIRTRVRTKKS